jgi:hypothetical protein
MPFNKRRRNNMARPLTEQQKLFLEVLFDEAVGDVLVAKKMANYSPTYPTSAIVKTLESEIIEATRQYLSRSGPKAALGVVSVLENPTDLGNKDKLAAAKDILDRIGVSKTEKVDITSNGIFILPSKAVDNDD